MNARRESIVLAPTPENVVVARRFVGSWLSTVTSDRMVIGDLELAVSELVTNAIEHGDHHDVSVELNLEGSLLSMSVTSRGNVGDLAPTAAWELAGAESVTGRGLGIVRAVVDQIDVTRDSDRVTITVGRNVVP
jgi:anti-sigma regulatory factor (Ser/Thr protein kinase)